MIPLAKPELLPAVLEPWLKLPINKLAQLLLPTCLMM